MGNSRLREEIIQRQNADIFYIVETHFSGDHISINIANYTTFYHNRESTNRRALRGSGGVAVLVKSNILSEYYVRVVDKSHDGILGLEFCHKITKFRCVVYVCYLPPENSCLGKGP